MAVPANSFKAYLAVALNSGEAGSEVSLDRVTTLTGETIETADFVDLGRGVLTVNPQGDGITSFPEFVSFTTVVSATKKLTGAVRGLDKTGTTDTDLMRYHPVGTPVILSFGAHQIQDIIDYVDDAVATVIGTADEDTYGTVKTSVAPAVSNEPTAVGTNDPRVPQNAFGTSAVGTDAYAITLTPGPAAYAAGQIYTFKADVANTGAATLKINSLAAITLKKNVSLDLETGDIAVGQLITVIHDGTNFQIISNVKAGPVTRSYLQADSPATWTKPIGLKYIDVEVWGPGGGGARSASGSSSGGGGGGGYQKKRILAGDLGTTETITIPVGGLGATSDGTDGAAAVANTTFGAHVTGYSGGGGGNLGGSGGGGGGGGGSTSVGGSATTDAGAAGGGPAGGAAGAGSSAFGGAGGGSGAGTRSGGDSAYGGGGGGGGNDTNGGGGGASWYGGAGGGSGGDGASSGGTSTFGGAGGAGTSSGAGTVGSVPGGGGGGGGAGNGGNGAAGKCVVVEYY